MVVIKGVPNIIGHDSPLTNINGVSIFKPSFSITTFETLYLTSRREPLTPLNLLVVFLKYFVGMIPSLKQLEYYFILILKFKKSIII